MYVLSCDLHYRDINLNEREVGVPSRTDIVVHIVPVVSLQFLRRKRNPGYFIRVVIRCMETVPVVDIEWWVRVSEN